MTKSHLSDPIFQQHKDKNICRLSLELLDTEDTHSEDPVEVEKWNEYVEKFVGSEEVSTEVKDHLQNKPIFLPRYKHLTLNMFFTLKDFV